MKLEEAVSIAKKYFENKKIPRTTREWEQDYPPGLCSRVIYKQGYPLSKVLKALNPLVYVSTRAPNIEYSIEALGFEYLNFPPPYKVGVYKCLGCGQERTTNRGHIKRWLAEGLKYCPTCRGKVIGSKYPEYYSEFLPKGYRCLETIPRGKQGATKVRVLHEDCGYTRTYNAGYIVSLPDFLVCSGCEGSGGFDSKHEKVLIEYLKETFPQLEVQTQLKYSDLTGTSRRWTLDVYIPLLNLALEVTTEGGVRYRTEQYFENLNAKLNNLKENGYIAHVVYTKEMVYDIVRTLLKSKEEEVTKLP